MRHGIRLFITPLMLFLGISMPALGSVVETKWGGSAEMVYDTGFMHMLKKDPGGGVCLFDMENIQNDAPGAGDSDKGVSSDRVWGEQRARKVLTLDDPRAARAWFLVYIKNYPTAMGKHPLVFSVNGNPAVTWDLSKSKAWRCFWTEFPVEWLKKGKNTIDFSCPDAKKQEEGWEFVLARADEYEHGGGDPAHVGETSFKSLDGGKNWKESPFGPQQKDRAEYSVRISLDRHVQTGWLATPVIDLWRGESEDFIIPTRTFSKMRVTRNTLTLSLRSEIPEETGVDYYLRTGIAPSPLAEGWEQWQLIGSGPALDLELGGELNTRYIQLKAVLKTSNPLKTPVVKSMQVHTKLSEFLPVPENIRVVEVDNPKIQYSSIDWQWEPWDRPEFRKIRDRENLDELIAGCRTEFEAQVKLMDYATKRFNWISPLTEYPGWDALSIIDRVDRLGSGGMCIQFNNFLGGLCLAYGWQTRLVNIVAHEVCEVWNDEFGKWIYLDSSYTNFYSYDKATLVPNNYLQIHNQFLDIVYQDRPIDWMYDDLSGGKKLTSLKPEAIPFGQGSPTQHTTKPYAGLNLAAFMRMLPRNNFYEKPTPMPLAHGMDKWPWQGYINWYDPKTPYQRNQSWFTDRPRDMWPDLNKTHIHALSSLGNDRLFLHFETYTPNFSHFEVSADDTEWRKTDERYTWFLRSGKNTLRVRAVSKLGVKGKPSSVALHYVDVKQREYEKIN
ncbi:MAG: hypothetical protein ACYC9O_09810 [Candidatus Latescibacterota bacterium]